MNLVSAIERAAAYLSQIPRLNR